jgi:hypothetical protein
MIHTTPIDKMTDQEMEEIMADHFAECSKLNNEITRRNRRLLKAIRSIKGKSFLKNLVAVLQECEVHSQLGIITEYQLSKTPGKSFVSEKYGKEIKGYWVDQWSVGTEGDSYEGYVYIEIKPNKYLKAFFSI